MKHDDSNQVWLSAEMIEHLRREAFAAAWMLCSESTERGFNWMRDAFKHWRNKQANALHEAKIIELEPK